MLASLKYLFGARLASGFGSGSTAEDVADAFADRISQSTIVITGANAGLGLETALQCSSHGGDVIMLGRNMEKLAEKAQKVREAARENHDVTVYTIECDLSDFDSVRRAAQQVRELELNKPLKVLLNNAGVMMCPRTVIDGIELQMRTNVFGHFLLTNELLPLLAQNTPARIVNVASMGHRFADADLGLNDLAAEQGYDRMRRYGNSKLGNMLHATALSERLRNANVDVQVVSLHPGVIPGSELGRHIPAFLHKMYQLMISPFSKSVKQGAATQMYCAFAPEIADGAYYADCNLEETAEQVDGKSAQSVRQQLWDLLIERTAAEWPL